jgi:hypothetical protein
MLAFALLSLSLTLGCEGSLPPGVELPPTNCTLIDYRLPDAGQVKVEYRLKEGNILRGTPRDYAALSYPPVYLVVKNTGREKEALQLIIYRDNATLYDGYIEVEPGESVVPLEYESVRNLLHRPRVAYTGELPGRLIEIPPDVRRVDNITVGFKLLKHGKQIAKGERTIHLGIPPRVELTKENIYVDKNKIELRGLSPSQPLVNPSMNVTLRIWGWEYNLTGTKLQLTFGATKPHCLGHPEFRPGFLPSCACFRMYKEKEYAKEVIIDGEKVLLPDPPLRHPDQIKLIQEFFPSATLYEYQDPAARFKSPRWGVTCVGTMSKEDFDELYDNREFYKSKGLLVERLLPAVRRGERVPIKISLTGWWRPDEYRSGTVVFVPEFFPRVLDVTLVVDADNVDKAKRIRFDFPQNTVFRESCPTYNPLPERYVTLNCTDTLPSFPEPEIAIEPLH